MEKQTIHFNNLNFIKTNNKYNIPSISDSDKKEYIKEFERLGWHNGELLSANNYDFREDKLYCGKSNFYDFLICHKIKQNISPIISVNGVIKAEDNIVLIKRPKNVSSYVGWWDFPAGMVYFDDNSLQERLYDRIMDDTKIKRGDLILKKRVYPSITLDNIAFNFFYLLDYKKSKKELECFFNENFKKHKPLILKELEVANFLKTNKMVFPEILEHISKTED